MDFEALKAYFDTKFAALTEQTKSSKPVVLEKKSNQDQYDHSFKILDLIKSIEASIRNENTQSALVSIASAKKELEKRIKLIRIADKSDFGWNTVQEYLSDDLASDSEDGKRIKKAEAEAERKRKKRQENSQSKRPRLETQATTSSDIPRVPFNKQFFRASQRNKVYRYEDRCFSCGRTGHWRTNCPSIKPDKASDSTEPKKFE